MTGWIESCARLFEIAGAVVIVLAVPIGAYEAVRAKADRVRRLRHEIGRLVLLGLELFVAADILLTVTKPLNPSDLLALGVIILLRTILSFTLEIELEGRLPWRRQQA